MRRLFLIHVNVAAFFVFRITECPPDGCHYIQFLACSRARKREAGKLLKTKSRHHGAILPASFEGSVNQKG